MGIKHLNEIISQSYSIKKLFPRINTIIEIGGEDSKLILMERRTNQGFFDELRLCCGDRVLS